MVFLIILLSIIVYHPYVFTNLFFRESWLFPYSGWILIGLNIPKVGSALGACLFPRSGHVAQNGPIRWKGLNHHGYRRNYLSLSFWIWVRKHLLLINNRASLKMRQTLKCQGTEFVFLLMLHRWPGYYKLVPAPNFHFWETKNKVRQLGHKNFIYYIDISHDNICMLSIWGNGQKFANKRIYSCIYFYVKSRLKIN